MKRILYRTAAVLISAAVLFCIPAQASVSVSAQSAVLIDGHSGRVLWEKHSEERALIASTTKIMTGLLIAEDCDLSETIRVPKEAAGIEGSSLYLKEGELLTVEQLLYGMMLQSGNDAAAALAIHHSGSIDAFSEAMNRKAGELGLKQTHFMNPHGLDTAEHYSTALDLAKLTAYAMNNSAFHKIVSCKTMTAGNRTFTNHNKLLWRYEGAVGVKTGYTKAAGRILVSCAERDNRRLIAVTISAPDDWDDHVKLLDYGFSAYAFGGSIVQAGQEFGSVPVIGGVKQTVTAVSAEAFSYMLKSDEEIQIVCQLPSFVYPPIVAGSQAGVLVLYLHGIEIGRLPLYWQETVMEEA